MNLLSMLPLCGEIKNMDFLSLQEIRLRAGFYPVYQTKNGTFTGKHCFSQQDLLLCAQILTDHALSLYTDQMKQGFIPLQGGHRLGLCGKIYEEQGQLHLTEISSLCLRFAHSFPHAADSLWPRLKAQNTLIIGPPGSGKTTFLRALIFCHTQNHENVCVADERGEIAACTKGVPQMDTGSCDVMSLVSKADAIPMMIRSMCPNWIAADELGSKRDAEAVLYAVRCGARVIITCHGKSIDDFLRQKDFLCLSQHHIFENAVILKSPLEDALLLPVGK